MGLAVGLTMEAEYMDISWKRLLRDYEMDRMLRMALRSSCVSECLLKRITIGFGLFSSVFFLQYIYRTPYYQNNKFLYSFLERLHQIEGVIQVQFNNKSLQYSLQSTCLSSVDPDMEEQLKNSTRKFKIFQNYQQQSENNRPFPSHMRPTQQRDTVINRANSLPSTSNQLKQTKTRLKIFDYSNSNIGDRPSQTLVTTKRRSMFEQNKTKRQIHQDHKEPSNQQANNKQKSEHLKSQRIKTQLINVEKTQKQCVLYTFCETQVDKRLVDQPFDKKIRPASLKVAKKDEILKPAQFAQMIQQMRMRQSQKRKRQPPQALKWVSESPFSVQKGKGLKL